MSYTYVCPDCGEERVSPLKVTMSHECPARKKKYPPSKSQYWASEFKLKGGK